MYRNKYLENSVFQYFLYIISVENNWYLLSKFLNLALQLHCWVTYNCCLHMLMTWVQDLPRNEFSSWRNSWNKKQKQTFDLKLISYIWNINLNLNWPPSVIWSNVLWLNVSECDVGDVLIARHLIKKIGKGMHKQNCNGYF